MVFGFSALGKAFLDCISKLINYQTVSIEHQETTTLVGDKKNLKKAVNFAEQIIEIAKKYEPLMSKSDKKKLKKLTEKFNKTD